ncbi:MAG TPA: hypothetical protein VKY29_07200 [Cryomorphaceae bacterium]|nr:hypothetical protein [Cryomorphaceae bacterium]
MNNRVGLVIILSVFVLLTLWLIMAPRLPSEKREVAKASADPIKIKIDQAVRLVHSGDNAMEGITMLLDIVREDSTQVDANWHLGQFSLTSQQFDNATKRFGMVIRHDTEGKYPQAYFWLAQGKMSEGHMDEAIPLLETYVDLETDTIIRNGVVRILERLKSGEFDPEAPEHFHPEH